ncbi:MAG: hypothetical protein JWQ09_5856 [Segetibacter sp.]|nr:hypothetical protein [Segetibacter sp.]
MVIIVGKSDVDTKGRFDIIVKGGDTWRSGLDTVLI